MAASPTATKEPATKEPTATPTTRDRIIERSAELFMTRGYAGSGLKEIARVSEATIGSLYHFFPGGKAELAAETLRAAGRAYGELVVGILDAAPDVVTGVEWCFEGAAQTLVDTDYADACPIATVALEVASSDDALRRVTAEVFADWHDAAVARLRAGGVADARANELATTIVAALEGGFLLSRAAKSIKPMRAIGASMVTLVAAALADTNT
jgi:AcrR family transcriptional regulator